ncbi:GDSL esterase/lipase [Morus notabilis]|uniref:GDSL esterase/lipase n=1 Tax=Morus notabilis TaxID=981085 RepID=W9SEC8_9ROSA|nr:GDSL esterase/lipase At5g03810 [Morus notabilis]EXC24924.1 GDSL esterase/lipase [Morus notabilis]
MDFQRLISLMASSSLFCLVLSLPNFAYGQYLTDRVPALFIFGDSVVDAGNNNELLTIIKANFPPYGRDFMNQRATGRFTNGQLVTDIIARRIGFPRYQAAYLSEEAEAENLLIGANFASAASGYYDATADLFLAIPLSKQLENYKEYQGKIVELIGAENASSLFSRGIHIVSTGSSDFLQNYYVNPVVNIPYRIDQFSNMLVQIYADFIEDLYGLGARRIGVTNLPPIGCLPAAMTLFGLGAGKDHECVEKLNRDAKLFNRKLNSTSELLKTRLPGLKLVLFDVYESLYTIIAGSSERGFSETRRGCCGTGLIETSVLCNDLSLGTCANATEYVFWDGFHPSEAANKFIVDDLISAAYSLVYN